MDEETLFHEALAKPPGEGRADFLNQACRGMPELRTALEARLRAYDMPVPPSDGPPLDSSVSADPPPVESLGALIGPYKLVQRLGEGGMGAVFLAEQQEPVRRAVALKVIKPGMDSTRILARFEQERQAVALMDHPHIAKVLDAGATPAGRPYFVMELVKGGPLTKFCDQQRLTVRHRLELFVFVCQAVQHAHQKGVIHRDLKPSNVLVAINDGQAVPKVIDFGVAKAAGPRLTQRSLFTEVGSIVGTLEYMAPEQAERDGFDIDTRADVYALGVLLYELLTGSTPFSAEQLRAVSLTETLRLIREVEPPRPSDKLSRSAELSAVAARRRVEQHRLTRTIRGELDWVVMKALEKDRGRRYETADGLARDVRRYLADRPVLAGPPTATYRVRKFLRRHRGSVAAAILVFLTLLAGVAVSTRQAVRATVAEREALRAERVANEQLGRALAAEELAGRRLEEAEKAKGETERALAASEEARRQAAAVSKYLVEAFRRPDPWQDGTQVRVVDLLDQAVAKLHAGFRGPARIKGELLHALGETYGGLGMPAKAVNVLTEAREVRKAALGPEHRETLQSMNELALAYRDAGRVDEALRLHEETLQLNRLKLGPRHPDTIQSMNNLALDYQDAGRLEEALPLHEEALRLYQSEVGPEHPDTLVSMSNLAMAYQVAGRLDEALRLHNDTLQLHRAKLGPDHVDTIRCMNNLAGCYQATGRLREAIPLYEQTLSLNRAKLGPEHPTTITSLNNLAGGYDVAGQLDKALPLYEEALRLRRAKLGPEHPQTLNSLNNLALSYLDAGDNARAEPLFLQLLDLQRKKFGPEHPAVAATLASVGLNLLRQKKFGDAEVHLRPCLAIRIKAQPDVWTTSNTKSLLGASLLGQDRYAEAEPLLLEGYRGMSEHAASIPPQHKVRLAEAAERLVRLYVAWGKPDRADQWRKQLKVSLPGKP
jgi:serine/threonine protein kinase/tetratricopeptide (TPR) repeat protein